VSTFLAEPAMKVLMLNYEFPPIGGGAANAHLRILEQYAGRDGLQVDVLTSAQKGGFASEKFSENITIYKVGIRKKDLHFWRKVEVIEWLARARRYYRRLLQENDYDLVHAFSGFPTGWLCYRTAGRIPYIVSLRGSDVPGKHARLQLEYKILAPVFRAIWRNAASLVACSEGLRSRALRFMSSVSIGVIPNGVDLERFYPAQDGEESEALRLLTVGRLSATKRIEMLIEAAEILHRGGCRVRLTIVGGGQLEQGLREGVSDRDLRGVVRFVGRVDPDDMPQVYRDSDVFVSASVQEGMSNAMLEAMASGLPIVSSRCEGVDELVTDNRLVVEPATAEGLAEAIRELAGDPQRRKRMSVAARSRAAQFSWSDVAEKYIEMYRTMCLREDDGR